MKAPEFELDFDNQLIHWGHDCAGIEPFTGKPIGWVGYELPIGMTWWMVKSNDPLTVEPEIYCPRCDVVGSILKGKWVKS